MFGGMNKRMMIIKMDHWNTYSPSDICIYHHMRMILQNRTGVIIQPTAYFHFHLTGEVPLKVMISVSGLPCSRSPHTWGRPSTATIWSDGHWTALHRFEGHAREHHSGGNDFHFPHLSCQSWAKRFLLCGAVTLTEEGKLNWMVHHS